MTELTPDLHQQILDAADQACEHELVSDVQAELLDNLKLTGQSLPTYGVLKVAHYAAQVGAAVALGIEPDDLRQQTGMGEPGCCVLAADEPDQGCTIVINLGAQLDPHAVAKAVEKALVDRKRRGER